MKERFSSLGLMVAKIRTPLIISALEGIIAGSLLFYMFSMMEAEWSFFDAIPFFLLTLILPSALVLHLSYTLPKKFADSWKKDKTIIACLTSVLLTYAYTFLLLCLLNLLKSGKDILENSTEEIISFILISPFSIFIMSVMYSQIILFFGLVPAMAVAFIATRGIGNKFSRIIFALVLACLIYSVSLFPIPMTFGT